jgi:hypothetical protein
MPKKYSLKKNQFLFIHPLMKAKSQIKITPLKDDIVEAGA